MNVPAEELPAGLVEPQMVCDACGRFVLTGTEWHSITEAHPRGDCANSGGAGYWVCGDCHVIIHDWMDQHQDQPNVAKEGFYRIITGLAAVLEQGPRKYRRKIAEES